MNYSKLYASRVFCHSIISRKIPTIIDYDTSALVLSSITDVLSFCSVWNTDLLIGLYLLRWHASFSPNAMWCVT